MKIDSNLFKIIESLWKNKYSKLLEMQRDLIKNVSNFYI